MYNEAPATEANRQPLVEVDSLACHRLAQLLREREIPIDREESTLPGLPSDAIGNFYLFLVAICHQTSPRGRQPLEGYVGGHHLRGWDYLQARLEQAVANDADLVNPRRWTKLTESDVRSMFRDPKLGERLTDPGLRAELIVDLGAVMFANGWRRAEDLYELCHQRIGSRYPNLLETLATFRAYADPVRKKSLFFLALMRNCKQWTYEDDEMLGSPVDYHEVRGHLRIGTVKVNEAGLRERLMANISVNEREDIAIRKAVYDAIVMLSELSGLRNPSQLHYLFWNVFRSICTREDPQCLEIRRDCSLPDRYVPLTVHEGGQKRCPFSNLCLSRDTPHRFYEHRFETDYY